MIAGPLLFGGGVALFFLTFIRVLFDHSNRRMVCLAVAAAMMAAGWLML